MAFHVKDDATDRAVRRLAKMKGTTLTDAIRQAVEREIKAERHRTPLGERLKAVQDAFAAQRKPGKGLPADKAFFDDLSGDV